MALQYSTPGVYIEELDAFPHSIVAVPTAIPAFIGYTEFAIDENGKPLNGIPYAIQSQSDYETYFGKGFKTQFAITPTGDIDTTAAVTRFYLYDSIRLFYANGGGQCYIVSAGTYDDPSNLPTPSLADLTNALVAAGSSDTDDTKGSLYKVPDVTLIVIPDAVSAGNDMYAIYQQVLEHCNDTQSRMGIFDLPQPTDVSYNGLYTSINDGTVGYRTLLSTNFPNYGAAYFPWLKCDIVADTDVDFTYLSVDLTKADLSKTFTDSPAIDQGNGKPVPVVNQLVINYNAALAKATGSDTTISTAKANATAAQNALDKANSDLTTANAATPKVAATIKKATNDVNNAKAQYQLAVAAVDQAQNAFNTSSTVTAARRALQLGLVASSAQYKTLIGEIADALNELPPSGAIAGIYTSVDNNRGVWKAPANVSINSVVAPSVKLDKNMTDNLNVDPVSGKSINAIRSFPGIGTLVFGARTLDGNSEDWRYISVRRTLIMMEQSIKLALRAYVFEPNDDTTWITVKSMIINFLTNMWKNGALAGAKPEDAFQVMCGLNVTMTAQDILDGYMRVSVLVAVVHPAEFIVLTFQQELQTS
jgi:phage tail sheath protein FI